MNPTLALLRQRWMALAPRERLLGTVAAGIVLGGLVWWLLIGPAVATLRAAPAQHQALDAQLQRMQALRAQAQALQAQPRQNGEDAARALEASVRQTLAASGRLAVTGDRATLTLANARADALAQWLGQARANARALPGEARLSRNASGNWDGTLVLALPPRSP